MCDLSALVGCWSSVSIRRIIYEFLNVYPFDYTAVAVSGKVERSWTGLTTPVGLTAVTSTDRPKSVHNRHVIEVFGGVFHVLTNVECCWIGFLTSQLTIFQSYVTANRCAGGLKKKLDLRCFFYFSVGVEAFVIGLSQTSSFFSYSIL